MNRKELESRIEELLLKRSQPLCILIKGEWGIGKTYFWKKFSEDKLKNHNHIYISLFGKNSTKDLQNDLVLQYFGLSKFVPKIMINFIKELFTSKIFKINFNIAPADILPLLKRFKKNKKDSLIVCFDEFERMSPNLNIKEVLGFISYLKDNLEYKIVIIMNEEKLTKINSDYREYKEKIIDYEIKFDPTIAENLQIIFDNNKNDLTDIMKKSLEEFSNEKNVKNLRILQKLANSLVDFKIVDDLISSENHKHDFYLILLELLYYAFETGITEMKKLKEKLIEDKRFYPHLLESNITIGEADYILDYIEYGMLTEQKYNEFKNLLSEINEMLNETKTFETYQKLKNNVLYNLKKPLDEALDELINLIQSKKDDFFKYNQALSVASFFGHIFKTLNSSDKINKYKEIIKEFIIDYFNYLSSKQSLSGKEQEEIDRTIEEIQENIGFIPDENLREVVKDLVNKLKNENLKKSIENLTCEKLKETIKEILDKSGWNIKKETLINNVSESFLENCLREDGEMLEICHKFYRFSINSNLNPFKDFRDKFKNCVKRIDPDRFKILFQGT